EGEAGGASVQREDPKPDPCAPPKNNVDAAVATAQQGSPSFARALGRGKRRGFEILPGAGEGSLALLGGRKNFIAGDVLESDAVIRVIYEVNNADNEVVLEGSRDKSKFKDGDAFAKERIDEESVTVMHAARMAEEAKRTYSTKIQGLIRPFLVQTPDGLNF